MSIVRITVKTSRARGIVFWLTILCASSPLFAFPSSQYLFVIDKLSQGPECEGFVDLLRLRLAREIKERGLEGYVFSSLELENIPLDEIKGRLKWDQRLFYLKVGVVDDPVNKCFVRFEVWEYPAGVLSYKSRLEYEREGGLWRRRAGREIIEELLGLIGLTDKDRKEDKTDKMIDPQDYILGKNIVINGDFSQGSDFRPLGWDRVDNLTSFWTREDDNCYVKFDTRVLQSEVESWHRRLKEGEDLRNAPAAVLAAPPYYKAVGGGEGVWLYSEYLKIRPGRYILSFRVRGPVAGSAKVFVKCYARIPFYLKGMSRDLREDVVGYKDKEDKTSSVSGGKKDIKMVAKEKNVDNLREVWRYQAYCQTQEEWKEHRFIFTIPKTLEPVVILQNEDQKDGKAKVVRYKPEIEKVRIMLYAYWPVGIYCFDDIELRPIVPLAKEGTYKRQDKDDQYNMMKR